MLISLILERGFLHIFMACSFYLIAFFALHCAMKRWPKRTLQIVPALLAAGFIGWREAYDVAHGQPLVKAFTDYSSWLIGMALAVWGLQRYRKMRNV